MSNSNDDVTPAHDPSDGQHRDDQPLARENYAPEKTTAQQILPPPSALVQPHGKRKKTVLRQLRNRIIAGLFVALPILITFLVILYICNLLIKYMIGPIARLLLLIWFEEVDNLPWAIEYIAAPLAAGLIVLGILFVAGMFFQSRLHRLVDWTLLTVPGINTIYSAVRNVFDSLQRSTSDADRFQRVVLIEFPHPGCKVPAFVTSECTEATTGQKILCIYVPTTPIPTSGYMLMVPEEDVVPLNWDIQLTLQAIVSGGISVPETVNYYRDDKLPNIHVERTNKNGGVI